MEVIFEHKTVWSLDIGAHSRRVVQSPIKQLLLDYFVSIPSVTCSISSVGNQFIGVENGLVREGNYRSP